MTADESGGETNVISAGKEGSYSTLFVAVSSVMLSVLLIAGECGGMSVGSGRHIARDSHVLRRVTFKHSEENSMGVELKSSLPWQSKKSTKMAGTLSQLSDISAFQVPFCSIDRI